MKDACLLLHLFLINSYTKIINYLKSSLILIKLHILGQAMI
jgi:hypothetical protein